MEKQYFEYRGVDSLVYARVVSDTEESFVTEPPKRLAPTAKITRATANSSAVSYYDNQPFNVVSSVGADTLGLTVTGFDLKAYAEIMGYDFIVGCASVESNRDPGYFAIGYRTKGTDGKHRYVWRYKGMFSIPDEESNTETDGTDTTNLQLTWTGIATTHKFNRTGKVARSIVVDERFAGVNAETFFSKVQTPDNLNITHGNRMEAPLIYPIDSVVRAGVPISVSIVSPSTQAKIYYTTDGTEPLANEGTSKLYSEPFVISKNTTVRAYVVNDGPQSGSVQPSDISTRVYVFE